MEFVQPCEKYRCFVIYNEVSKFIMEKRALLWVPKSLQQKQGSPAQTLVLKVLAHSWQIRSWTCRRPAALWSCWHTPSLA